MVFPATDGKRVTVLSIDGALAYGIVPAVLLKFLEEQLKELDEKENGGRASDVKIADYFDVIGGTGTGSVLAALLTKPSNKNSSRPEYGMPNIISSFKEIIRATFSETKTDPDRTKKLSDKLKSKLGETRLDETLSDVVIPALNFETSRPVVFSTDQAKKHDGVTLIRDAVLSSSATPTLFPFYSFNYLGKLGKFADGSIVANNPTLLALTEGAKLHGSGPNYNNFLVLSLGTIQRKPRHEDIWLIPSYIIDVVANVKWEEIKNRFLQYLYILLGDIMEMYMTRMLPADPVHLTDGCFNYLRIQGYEQTIKAPSTSDGSEKALKELMKIADGILDKPVTFADPHTGAAERQKITNRNALMCFARQLHAERQTRLSNKKH